MLAQSTHAALAALLRLLPRPQDLLQRKSDMVGWHERHPELFHRSNWGVGPRRGLMPLLQSYSNGSGRRAVLGGGCGDRSGGLLTAG